MKKSSFVGMVLGTVSGLMFSLGLCMALIPQWNAMKPGLVFGCVGLVLAFVTLAVWRRMEHKEPIKISGKAVLVSIAGIIGALALGVGMCFVLVWEEMIPGIIIGIAGIVILLCLIPLTKGIKN